MRSPAVEPSRRRARIELSLAGPVLLEVHQDINDRMPDRPRRSECALVVAIAPDGAAATERAIDGPREPDRESAHPRREKRAVICFDDEVNVIVLDRVMDDPEPPVRGGGKRAAYGREDTAGPKAADRVRGPESDMDRMCGPVPRSAAVRY